MKTLTLEAVHIFQLLNDDRFYTTVYGLDTLREEGQRVYKEAVDAAMRGSCSGCHGLRKTLQGIINKIGAHMSYEKSIDPRGLEEFKKYVEEKRGYRLAKIVLYYKDDSGKPVKLEI